MAYQYLYPGTTITATFTNAIPAGWSYRYIDFLFSNGRQSRVYVDYDPEFSFTVSGASVTMNTVADANNPGSPPLSWKYFGAQAILAYATVSGSFVSSAPFRIGHGECTEGGAAVVLASNQTTSRANVNHGAAPPTPAAESILLSNGPTVLASFPRGLTLSNASLGGSTTIQIPVNFSDTGTPVSTGTNSLGVAAVGFESKGYAGTLLSSDGIRDYYSMPYSQTVVFINQPAAGDAGPPPTGAGDEHAVHDVSVLGDGRFHMIGLTDVGDYVVYFRSDYAVPPAGADKWAVIGVQVSPSGSCSAPHIERDHRGLLYACYARAGGNKEVWSGDDGKTWSSEVSFVGTKWPRRAFNEQTGIVLRVGYDSGKLKGTIQQPGDASPGAVFTLKDDTGTDLAPVDGSFDLTSSKEAADRFMLAFKTGANMDEWFSGDDGQTWKKI